MKDHFIKLRISGNLPPIDAIVWGPDSSSLVVTNRSMVRYLENKFGTLESLVECIEKRNATSAGILQAISVFREFGWVFD